LPQLVRCKFWKETGKQQRMTNKGIGVEPHIAEKLYTWIKQVKLLGLSEIRKIKGYHDEPLKGDRDGQRSIRLNKAYRAIYVIGKNKTIKFAEIKEVNKHDY